jgi:hypothetical protein
MASFTDNPQLLGTFNPYVAQLPVDAMVKVGMQKQKQYDEGIQKIQTNIDNIAGLDVSRDVDKAYLQSKLNQLGNDTRIFAMADFSNAQMVNSVNGMTNSLIKDNNIQTAVSSTAKLRKEQGRIEKDIQDGKSNPANTEYFNKRAQNYLNSSDIGENFNASYISYFDVDKFARETFDAVKPDGFSYDQIYQLGADGKPSKDAKGNLILSPTMTRMEKEGIFPPKVKATLEQIFSDARVGQQLDITGQYNYRNLNPNQLSEKIIQQKESIVSGYENQINELILQKSMGKDVQKDIDDLTSKMTTVSSSYDDYAKSAMTNPDGVRGALYKDDVSARYTTMFGQIKDKSQVMENPEWNQNWKMQTEANRQSEFAQTLRQRKIEHADTKQYQYDSLAQAKELALIAAKGKKQTLGGADGGLGSGPGGIPSEQAAQSAAIETMRVQATDFENAANDYSNASDSFIWETIFSKVPNNGVKLKGLMDKGMKRDQAIALLINNGAKVSNKTPEEYKSYWSSKASLEYKKLTPEQQAARPVIADAYQTYRNSKRIFDSQLIVNERIKKQTKAELGEVGNKIAMTDFKPQVITYNDRKYTVDKQDMLDLAIYKKGNLGFMQSIFGGEDSRLLEEESKFALARLTKRGKGALAEAYLKDNENVTIDQNGKATRMEGDGFFGSLKELANIPDRLRYQSEGWGGTTRNWNQVHSIEGMLNNEVYSKGIQKKAEIIQQHYNIHPNRNINIITGDAETDKGTIAQLRRFAGEAVSGAGNLSPDYKEFGKNVKGDINDITLGARTIFDENNNPMVEVISYGEDSERKAGITLTPDQATNIGIDLGSLYESKEASALRNKLNFNNYKTSEGDPSDKSTYVNEDAYYDKTDFPGMKGNKTFDVQANIIYNGGKYYPFIYVSDGKTTPNPIQLNGDENLENLITSLKNVVTPTFVNGLMTNPN